MSLHTSRSGMSGEMPAGASGRRQFGLVPIVILAMGGLLRAGEWTTYRCDNARSAVTEDCAAPPLKECWVFRPGHAPDAAWGDPNPRPVGGWHGAFELRRFHFDDAFHVTVSEGAVYFASSADGSVVSLDAATGKPRWRTLTGGPVRLAPALWQDKVYVGSDDGRVYCLRKEDGTTRWTFDAAPNSQRLLGSGKMISRWPVRTGVLVDDGVAYFGAGIFPAEGVYLYAVDAEDGKLVWCNDTCGAAPQSRISPQGYLLASKERLFTPLGRVSPAAFDRKDGHLLYEAYIEHIIGGTNAVLSGDQLFTGTEQMIGFDEASFRARSSWFWGESLVVTPKRYYSATGTELFAVDREGYGAASLQRKKLLDQKRDLANRIRRAIQGPKEVLKKLEAEMDALNVEIGKAEAGMAEGEVWRVLCDCKETLALGGNVLFAGGDKKVVAFDAESGKTLWTGTVDGKARGLAIAEGRLFVSSDSGAIYCFGPNDCDVQGVIEQPIEASPYPADDLAAVCEAAARHIVETTGVQRGYCLILGCGTGRLALELAKRTDLTICGVEPDLAKVEAARRALDAAGVYGARVTIVHANLDDVPFSDYFANLIVSEDALISGEMPAGGQEALRMLKPLGGTVCIGQPADAAGKTKPLGKDAMEQWLTEAGMEGGQVVEEGGVWLTVTRGPLPGVGSWTHQYAGPGNTACSDDQFIRCPLGLLWYGGPGPQKMAERHRRAAAPLAIGGRMFIQGEGLGKRIGEAENSVMAYDAYNGMKLWERSIRGALRVTVTHDAGNSAANADSFFIAVDDTCVRLDAATGETKHVYKLPPAGDGQPRSWGYVAVVGDLLYGSRTSQGRTADCVFALNLSDGQVRWKYESKSIGQGAIAIGDGRLFLATSDVSMELRKEALEEQARAARRMSAEERPQIGEALKDAAVYRVVALDAVSGQKLWEKPAEITGAVGGSHWCSLGAIYHDDVLVLFGVFLDGHYWKEFFAGQFEARRVVALSGQDGGLLWQKNIGYRVRPVVIGDTLHAEPWAYDLRTGQQRTRMHPVTGHEEAWQFARPGHHCGCPAASPHIMLFRSFTTAWYDLDSDFGTQHFGSQRPGCWINFIPANGLVMVPEASSGCLCPFPNMCTLVFEGKKENRQWAYFSQPGDMLPVKHLALNLGAPGDRKDASGVLWLGYPRPRGSLVLQFDVDLQFYPTWRYFRHDPARLPVDGTDKPWLFRTGACGVKQCVIPVATAKDGTARYTVRLAFAELEHDAAGERVFDIKLQGNVVAKDFDALQEAGGKDRPVIREFKGIEAGEKLTVEFLTKAADPSREQLPILQGIEIVRE